MPKPATKKSSGTGTSPAKGRISELDKPPENVPAKIAAAAAAVVANPVETKHVVKVEGGAEAAVEQTVVQKDAHLPDDFFDIVLLMKRAAGLEKPVTEFAKGMVREAGVATGRGMFAVASQASGGTTYEIDPFKFLKTCLEKGLLKDAAGLKKVSEAIKVSEGQKPTEGARTILTGDEIMKMKREAGSRAGAFTVSLTEDAEDVKNIPDLTMPAIFRRLADLIEKDERLNKIATEKTDGKK